MTPCLLPLRPHSQSPPHTTDTPCADEQNPQAINKTTEIIECQHSKVDLDRILGLQSFDLEKILSMDPAFLEVRPLRRRARLARVWRASAACWGGASRHAPPLLALHGRMPAALLWLAGDGPPVRLGVLPLLRLPPALAVGEVPGVHAFFPWPAPQLGNAS